MVPFQTQSDGMIFLSSTIRYEGFLIGCITLCVRSLLSLTHPRRVTQLYNLVSVEDNRCRINHSNLLISEEIFICIHPIKKLQKLSINKMQGGEDVSIEELASNLSTYKLQLQQIQKLLDDDPGNSEYADMEKELVEVIALTEELLETARLNENETGASADSHDFYHSGSISQSNMESGTATFDHSDKFSVGTRVQAVWSEDGEWYDATIEALTPNGYYVCYNTWGNKEEVDPANVQPIQEGHANPLLEAEREAEATRQALKRKIAQAAGADFQSRSLPAKLRIDPNDTEDVKATKRKKIHAFKSKIRMEQLEVAQNKRQNAWQQFQTTKGRAKKIGFYSGHKRESIFKSPDDPQGKVGVTGSGKGLTEFQKREKHLHLKGANIETTDD